MCTSAEDVLRKFCTSAEIRTRYENWRADPRRADVVPVVMNHRTEVLYGLGPSDVEEVCHRTEHALGKVKREEGEAISEVVDWHPDFAFTHMFHVCVEASGHLPTFQEFREFTEGSPLGRKMLGDPARSFREQLLLAGHPRHLVKAGMRWRVGNSYYSFLREVHTIVTLRHRGVEAQAHPLADALFRADAWVGSTVISLLVGNKRFRAADTGRKLRPELLLRTARPPLRFETLELGAATKFGVVHLPSSSDLESAVARLLKRDT